MPLFITSDSLINAYRVLYEESILRLETVRAAKLPEILKFILTNLNNVEESSKINDKIAFPQNKTNQVSELDFRIISAYRTPGSVLFQQTTDRRFIQRSFPEGLEICAALGSEFAKNKISFPQKKLLKIIEKNQKLFKGNSLYFDYLDALKSLLDKPEPETPDFMKNNAWKAKSCNTVLAGWAQLRHTWSLQAKQTICSLGLTYSPAGFVEPNPDFWGKMADLAVKTREVLKKSGAFTNNYNYILFDLIKFKKKMKNVDLNNIAHFFSPADVAEFGTALTILIAGPSTVEVGSVEFFSENSCLFVSKTTS